MKISDTQVTRYEEGNFTIDIVETAKEYEAWLGHDRIGIKSLMFGMLKSEVVSYEAFIDTVTANLPWYMNAYKEDYYM